jgi:hypothetical protein
MEDNKQLEEKLKEVNFDCPVCKKQFKYNSKSFIGKGIYVFPCPSCNGDVSLLLDVDYNIKDVRYAAPHGFRDLEEEAYLLFQSKNDKYTDEELGLDTKMVDV